MIQVIHLEKKLTDKEEASLRGTYLDCSHFDLLLEEDSDVYDKETGELILKFRKNVFSPQSCDLAFHAYKHLAKASRGQGAKAGPIDPESVYWKKRKLLKYDKWSANYEVNGKPSKMKVNNEVASNAIGYWGTTKKLGVDLPCRLSHYTRTHFYKYQEGLPYIQEIAKSYQELNPEWYDKQMDRAMSRPKLRIPDTPFSTITVNRNFRTATHTDRGDYGFGNVSVLERGKYHGGYLVIPKWKVAVNLRMGDHLCADVHNYHGNTELWENEEDKAYNDQMEDIFKDNLEVGVLGLNNRYCRLSFVCYLREDLQKCDENLYQTEYLAPMLSDKSIKTFYINLLNASQRRVKFQETKAFRWNATTREEVPEEFRKSMISYHNLPEQTHLGKCACYLSHLSLLKEIVKYKLNNVLILEDDAIQISKLPPVGRLPVDSITYFGGFFGNKKITSKEKIEINSKKGINVLDTSMYRILMTMSYFVPRWEVASSLLLLLNSKKRQRAIDIELGNMLETVYYYYPAIFIEEDIPSTIRKGRVKHSTKDYKFEVPKKIKK